MLDPLSIFKQSLLKKVKVMDKTFTFDLSKPLKSLNKVDILVNGLKAVENLNLTDFSEVKQSIERGLTEQDAIKQEIESWEPEIINILVNKYIELLKNQEPIDFKKLPDLRIYWKLRKIFSKEEIDNFSDIDYQWAIWNLQEDFKEKDEFDDRQLEKRKPWYSIELFNHIHKVEEQKKSEEQENKLLIQKLMEKQGIDSNNYEIELVEEEDIPTVIEEK